ncbi:hypothetical protein ACFV0H_19875 [Streptomyces erythrochromogenes]|uniref:hypothetical protein n=1 Tax=Streptomyces erythrochromogenes TaxID=285574 RepID=UPI0036795BC1
MSSEIVQLVQQAGPYLTTAISAYGVAVFTRAESAAADATANLGQRVLQAVWRRRDQQDRAEFEAAVQDAAEAPEDADAAAAVRQQIKRALREDTELMAELAGILRTSGVTINVTASGTRSIAAKEIGTAVTGDNTTLRHS